MMHVLTKGATDYKSQLDTIAVAQQPNSVQGLPRSPDFRILFHRHMIAFLNRGIAVSRDICLPT
jgi:hypothetical protein